MSIRNAPIPAVSNRNGLVVMFPEDTPSPFCPRVTCPAPPDVDPPPEPAQFTVDMTGCEEVTIELIRNSTAPVLLTTYPTTIPLETGDQIRLDASTSQDCTFQGWDDGDGTQLSTDNPYTFTVTQTDMTVRAVFEAGEPQITLAPLSAQCQAVEDTCPDVGGNVIFFVLYRMADIGAGGAVFFKNWEMDCDEVHNEWNWFDPQNPVDPADYEVAYIGTYQVTGDAPNTENIQPGVWQSMDAALVDVFELAPNRDSSLPTPSTYSITMDGTVQIRRVADQVVVASEPISVDVSYECGTPEGPQAQTTTGLVFKTDGTPYATEASATQAMTARGIEGTPVEVDGGWAIEVTQS